MKGLSGAATVLALLLAVPLQSQAGPGSQRGMRGQGNMQGQGQMMGGSQQMGMGSADQILWLREELNLTDEQVESLESAEEEARAAHDGARLQMRGMRDQLRDEKITQGQFLDLMTAHRDAMMQQRTANRERVEAILTDEQRDQMQSLRGRGPQGAGMWRGRGHGRGHGHGSMRGAGGRRGGQGMRGFDRNHMPRRGFGRGGFIR